MQEISQETSFMDTSKTIDLEQWVVSLVNSGSCGKGAHCQVIVEGFNNDAELMQTVPYYAYFKLSTRECLPDHFKVKYREASSFPQESMQAQKRSEPHVSWIRPKSEVVKMMDRVKQLHEENEHGSGLAYAYYGKSSFFYKIPFTKSKPATAKNCLDFAEAMLDVAGIKISSIAKSSDSISAHPNVHIYSTKSCQIL